MSYHFQQVKRYKRGAKWPDGTARMCIRCGIERSRRKQASVTALLAYNQTDYVVPVAYCEEHEPEGVRADT